MVSVETEVGEFGFYSLHLCEVDLEEEAYMVMMVQDSLLLSLITIMVEMFFYKLLVETQLLFLSQHPLLIVILMRFRPLLMFQELRFNQQVMQQVFQDNKLLMLFNQVMLQQLLSQLLVAAMLKVQLQLRVMRTDQLQLTKQLLLQVNLTLRLL